MWVDTAETSDSQEPRAVTYGVVDDDEDWSRPQSQITLSLAETKTMQRMEGGICLENWLRIRGLDGGPTVES